MKAISEAIGSTNLRAVLLPGLVLTIGLHPFVVPVLDSSIGKLFSVNNTALLLVEIATYGLLFGGLAYPIFFLYEGFLTPTLSNWFVARRSVKLERYKKRLRSLRDLGSFDTLSVGDQIHVSMMIRRLLDYPVRPSKDGLGFFAQSPTLLGNIIASYELYPESRYGLDGELYWSHIVYLAPEEARSDFREKVTLGESFVLTSAAGAAIATLGAATLILRGIGWLFPAAVIGRVPFSDFYMWFLLSFGLVVFYILYRAAIPLYRDIGRSFQALTDLSFQKVRQWIEEARLDPDREFQLKARTLGRFLRFQRAAGEAMPEETSE